MTGIVESVGGEGRDWKLCEGINSFSFDGLDAIHKKLEQLRMYRLAR